METNQGDQRMEDLGVISGPHHVRIEPLILIQANQNLTLKQTRGGHEHEEKLFSRLSFAIPNSPTMIVDDPRSLREFGGEYHFTGPNGRKVILHVADADTMATALSNGASEYDPINHWAKLADLAQYMNRLAAEPIAPLPSLPPRTSRVQTLPRSDLDDLPGPSGQLP